MNSIRWLLRRQSAPLLGASRSYIRRAEAEKLKKRLVNPDKITRETDAKWLAIVNEECGASTLERFPVDSLFTVEDLFNAKFHWGHKEGSLDPRMRPFLYGSRLGHLVFDLDKTASLLADALNFAAHVAARDGVILFVSRHPPTVNLVEETARNVGEFSHCRPWRKGLFPNSTKQFGTVTRLPDLVIVPHTRDGALGPHDVVTEAAKVLVPTIALVDSDCDPSLVTYPVPGNDDSISSVKLFLHLMSKAISVGKAHRLDSAKTVESSEAESDITRLASSQSS